MANYAYYCLHKLKIRACEFLEMDEEEKAFTIAAIDLKLDEDKKAAAKMKKKK